MSERYSKLFTLPENLYATGSPVVIAAGALLKDNQTGKVLAQLKLRNIGKKTIKAATVSVEPLDTVGKPLGEPVTYQYLDLHADRDADFGQKAPVALPDSATRSFAVSVAQVIFTDNSIWNADSVEWKPLSRPQPLDALGDSELAKQFRIEYGGGCENLLLEQKDLWHCVCGAVNHQEEPNCHKCGKSLAELRAIDMEGLRKNKEERVAKERAEAELARKKVEIARTKAKKTGKIVAVAAAILTVIILSVTVLPGMIQNAKDYNAATALMKAGQYEDAIVAFEAMDGYRDSVQKIQECEYQNAMKLMNQGQYQAAIKAFNTLGDYRDSSKQSRALWECIAVRDVVSAGKKHTVGLKSDGTVVAVGNNGSGQCNVSNWTDIVAVSAGLNHTVGLKSYGTVAAVGDNEYGQCNVSNWTNIVAISTGFRHTVGLKSDGTVVAVGNNESGQCDVSNWRDIVAISAGGWHTVGLKSDGTVVAVGSHDSGRCNVSNWTDIVAISSEGWDTVGLKSDGTVVVAASNHNVSKWKDIVTINGGGMHTVGLESDGTVVAVGNNYSGQCNVSEWRNIISISTGYEHTVGLKNDGTVVAVGDNEYGQCDVSNWTDIMLP